jgi:hypothetical protein
VRRIAGFVIALAALAASSPSRADVTDGVSEELRRWSGSNALTVPHGRWEFGLFGASHYGLTDSVELSLHPVFVFALPHLEAKIMAAREHRRFSKSCRRRVNSDSCRRRASRPSRYSWTST